MTKTTNENAYAFVYRKDYAMKLIEMGHQVFTTMPNPQKSHLMMWVFIEDATFNDDLKSLLRGGRRND